METEIAIKIINELQTISLYLNIIIILIFVWLALISLTISLKIFTGFKKPWDTQFENMLSTYLDTGEYEKLIEACQDKLSKYPNHTDALWFLSKACFYTKEDELSKACFEKVLELKPGWEADITPYLEKLKQRLNET